MKMTEDKLISYDQHALVEAHVDEEALSSTNHHMREKSSLNYCQGSRVGQVKITRRQVAKKLKSLEEESYLLKQAIVESMIERRTLMYEIREQLRRIIRSLFLKNQQHEESRSKAWHVKAFKVGSNVIMLQCLYQFVVALLLSSLFS